MAESKIAKFKMAEFKMAKFKMAESKIAEFQMAAINKLSGVRVFFNKSGRR